MLKQDNLHPGGRKMRTLTIFSFMLFMLVPPSFAFSNGKGIYEKNCRMCHAVDGTGNPGMAKLFKVDPELLNLTSEKNKKRSNKELKEVVRKGQGKMPKYDTNRISDEEIEELIAYIRGLQTAKK